EQMARLSGDTSRPLLQGHDPAARLEQLARERDPLYAAVADLRVDTGGSTPGQEASRSHAALEGRWRGVAAGAGRPPCRSAGRIPTRCTSAPACCPTPGCSPAACAAATYSSSPTTMSPRSTPT